MHRHLGVHTGVAAQDPAAAITRYLATATIEEGRQTNE